MVVWVGRISESVSDANALPQFQTITAGTVSSFLGNHGT